MDQNVRITFLSGGTGTPKLILGFRDIVTDNQIKVVGNTGDDDEFYGLLVSPDVDTLLYLFAGDLDLKKFWGVKEESFNVLKKLKHLQEEDWFQLGDKDLALHLMRNKLRGLGYTPTQIVQNIRERFNIKAEIFPMSNDKIRTKIITKKNEQMTFQEYTVKFREQVNVKTIIYNGIDKAKTSIEVRNAILNTNYIIIGPSNPITSINPIIGIKGIRKALIETKAKIIAVSPIEKGRAFSGPAAVLMKQLGLNASPTSIAKLYKEFIDWMVISEKDKGESNGIFELGIDVLATNISLQTNDERRALAEKIIAECF